MVKVRERARSERCASKAVWGVLYIEIPPHCGRRNALDLDGVPSLFRILRGVWEADGMKRRKWRTGSFEALDADSVSEVTDLCPRRIYSHNVHSAEFTKTVRSS